VVALVMLVAVAVVVATMVVVMGELLRRKWW
jgi:hypothetical protein